MRKVLVIDDEKATLTMFGLFLKAYGYAVLTAENGERGLDLLNVEAPSIVFTDLKMPGMDGFAVLRSIKRLKPATEVIVITGHGDMDLVIQALNLEATDFINKPVTRRALDAALKRAETRLQLRHPQSAEITLKDVGRIARIDIGGTLGKESRPALKEVFQQAFSAQTGVVLHFERNAAVNGAGIGDLATWLAKLRRRQTRAAISGLSDNFQTIFEMVGLGRYADFFPSAEEAIRDLEGS
ncbi:MAG: response regulator [Desulfosarcinaceae bacterium]|nr:response regulator [Desulfosarcinaceae bacterium]